jgi:hypothetical protein
MDHARCTRQLVQIAAKNARFHSNQTQINQFIAETVILNTNHPADSKL